MNNSLLKPFKFNLPEKTLVITGLSGSGKTTAIRNYLEQLLISSKKKTLVIYDDESILPLLYLYDSKVNYIPATLSSSSKHNFNDYENVVLDISSVTIPNTQDFYLSYIPSENFQTLIKRLNNLVVKPNVVITSYLGNVVDENTVEFKN